MVAFIDLLQFSGRNGLVSKNLEVFNKEIKIYTLALDDYIGDHPYTKNDCLYNERTYNSCMSFIYKMESCINFALRLRIITHENFMTFKLYLDHVNNFLLDRYFPSSES